MWSTIPNSRVTQGHVKIALSVLVILTVAFVLIGNKEVSKVEIDFTEYDSFPQMDSGGVINPLIGFLHGYPKSSDDWERYVKPLKPTFWRNRTIYEDTLSTLLTYNKNVHYQAVLSGSIRVYREEVSSDRWPFNNQDKWLNYVKDFLNRIPDSLTNQMSLDIWNEPNAKFWKGTEREFFDLFCETVSLINQLNPQITTVGPSTTARGKEYVLQLLKHMREWKLNNPDRPLRLDYLSIHSGGNYWVFKDAGTFWSQKIIREMAYSDLGIKGFIYNEYLGKGATSDNFAWALKFLSDFEKLGVVHAARACWGTCFNGSLTGLLDFQDGKVVPNHMWFGYKEYSQFRGHRFKTKSSKDLSVIAADIDGTKKILLGNVNEDNDIVASLVLIGVENSGIKIYEITNEGKVLSRTEKVLGERFQFELKLKSLTSYLLDFE